jgi:hypothetical protein
LKDIFISLNNADKEWLNYKINSDLKNAEYSSEKTKNILQQKQGKIFEILKKEATETQNTEKLKKVADNFKEL